MERIFQGFKDLYKGENVVKKHLLYVFLLLFPSLLGALSAFVDKSTPKEIVLIIGLVACIVALISLVPACMLLGVWVDFIKDRLEGRLGIPSINWQTLKKGLCFFPLAFVWSLYYIFLSVVVFIVPLFFIIAGFSVAKNIDVGGVIGSLILLVILFVLLLVIVLVLAPFYNYIVVKYVKLKRYTPDMFNPFSLIGYIKKSFKSTMIVMLKMLLASMLANMLSGIVTAFAIIVVFFVSLFAMVMTNNLESDAFIYSPMMMGMILTVSVLCGIIQAYVGSMVGFVATDNYIDVYKKEIEPKEQEI